MATGNANELMQEGIKQVRDGRTGEAYDTFKQVAALDPDNEFAWIWISVTSQNKGEKRQALNRALDINPNSQHAREALRALDTEERNQDLTAPVAAGTVYSGATAPAPAAPLNPRIGSAEVKTSPNLNQTQGDPLRAALTDQPTARMKSRPAKPPKAAKSVPATRMVSQKPARARSQAFAQRLRVALLFVFVIILALLGVFFITQQRGSEPVAQNTSGPLSVSDPGSPTPLTTAATETSAAPTGQTSPAATTAPASGSTNPASTGGGNTPFATGSAAPATVALATGSGTTAAATQSPAPTVTFVASSGVATLPAGASQTAQIARALQTARENVIAGNYQAAISAYQSVLQADSRNVPANVGLGTIYLTAPSTALPAGTQPYAEAVRAFRTVTAQSPNWPGGFARLGEALALSGDTKGAIAAFARSLELDPNGPERWLALAALYDKEGQAEQARFARDRSAGIVYTPTPVPTATPPPPPPPPPGPTATPRR